jgi:translation elongation factor EF-4
MLPQNVTVVIFRKRKLLEKQKKGKRMRQVEM